MLFSGGALVSSALTKQAVHRPSKQYTFYYVGALETSAPPFGYGRNAIPSYISIRFNPENTQKKLFCNPLNPMQILYKSPPRKNSFWRKERRVFRFKKAKVGRKAIKIETF